MSFTYKDVKITWFGHASFMLEWKEERIYLDPYVLPETTDMEPASVIIHTHGHYDHCVDSPGLETQDTKLLGSCKHATNKPGDSVKVRDVRIEFVPAYNPEKRFHPKGTGTGVVIELGNTRIYHAGDTELIPEMSKVKCDVALLPIGGTFTMDLEQAVKAVETIRPRIAIPMHYNYIEGTSADPKVFARLVKEKAPETEVVVLETG